MKKILMISYYFPPSGGAGVQRTLKFVKYLPQFSWMPVILTVKNASYPAIDNTLFNEIPKGTHVYRTFIPEPYKLYRKFTRRESDVAIDVEILSRDFREKRRISERISEFIRASFFIPDARIGWLPFAVIQGIKILNREKIDLLYSSAPPYTCHLIGYFLKKISGKPWVADFRDSWVGWLSTPKRPLIPYKIDRYLEQLVLHSADKILTVSKGVAEDLQRRNPEVNSQKWAFLPNGYDSADFVDLKPLGQNEKFTITYTGSLYGHRNPQTLLRALEELFRHSPELRKRIKLRFVGRIGKNIEKMLKAPQWNSIVEVISYVSHQESIRYLLGSDVALLVIDEAPANCGILTGKLFEYLGARKPILALAPEGEAATLINRLGAGVTVPPKDIQSIKRALLRLYESWEKGTLNKLVVTQDKLRIFERRNLTKQLIEIFSEVLQSP